jgi:hypothetical protein
MHTCRRTDPAHGYQTDLIHGCYGLSNTHTKCERAVTACGLGTKLLLIACKQNTQHLTIGVYAALCSETTTGKAWLIPTP